MNSSSEYEYYNDVVCKNIKRCRQAQELTQEELGNRIRPDKMHRSRICEIEKGRFSPTIRTVAQIAVAMGVEPWELLADSSIKENAIRVIGGKAARRAKAINKRTRALKAEKEEIAEYAH